MIEGYPTGLMIVIGEADDTVHSGDTGFGVNGGRAGDEVVPFIATEGAPACIICNTRT